MVSSWSCTKNKYALFFDIHSDGKIQSKQGVRGVHTQIWTENAHFRDIHVKTVVYPSN